MPSVLSDCLIIIGLVGTAPGQLAHLVPQRALVFIRRGVRAILHTACTLIVLGVKLRRRTSVTRPTPSASRACRLCSLKAENVVDNGSTSSRSSLMLGMVRWWLCSRMFRDMPSVEDIAARAENAEPIYPPSCRPPTTWQPPHFSATKVQPRIRWFLAGSATASCAKETDRTATIPKSHP